MHVSVSARFTLREIEKDYLGLRGETWSLAKKEPMPLPVLGAILVRRLIDFWIAVHRDHTIEEINNWIVDMAALIGELRIEGDTDGST